MPPSAPYSESETSGTIGFITTTAREGKKRTMTNLEDFQTSLTRMSGDLDGAAEFGWLDEEIAAVPLERLMLLRRMAGPDQGDNPC